TEHGYDVGNKVAFDHFGQHTQVDEGWRTGAGPPRFGGAIGDDVIAQFAVAGLGARVDFAAGGFKAAVGHDHFKVVDEAFDGAVGFGLGGNDILGVGRNAHGTAGDGIDELVYDGHGLLHFFDADEEA